MGLKEKNVRVHPISSCSLPSKVFHDLQKFHGKPFLNLSENLLLNKAFLYCLFKKKIDICLTLKNYQCNYQCN